ncbi:MAG: hypothetical protein GZ093_19855 [Rhodoferax sp.]|uniref:hypothetical protein n=1 Tax=Rhodoferax sp. TaxID=50421 RepID=UPI0013FFE990|nr:hypothetical protein [Rhodoferax sp.]NDP40949.1 hypothetical protein [Rhodoferax sp.]
MNNKMPRKSKFFLEQMYKLNQGLDRLLHAFSTYALPILIGLVSLLALFAWKTGVVQNRVTRLPVIFSLQRPC